MLHYKLLMELTNVRKKSFSETTDDEQADPQPEEVHQSSFKTFQFISQLSMKPKARSLNTNPQNHHLMTLK